MKSIKLDSYECGGCGAWSHYEQPTDNEQDTPEYCPYCGETNLEWRTDNNWKLVEVVA